MTNFNNLPTELLHPIAQYLAPNCYEDSKDDILAFRLVKRQTWLVANRYAFEYMALHVLDPASPSQLGRFGREVRGDPSGFDIRCSVREVRFTLDPMIVAPDWTTGSDGIDYTWNNREKWFHKHAQNIFAKTVGKRKGTDLCGEEKAISEHYWRLCVEPYLPQRYRNGDWHGHEKRQLDARIQTDLANLPSLQVISVDLERHAIDTRSESYQVLKRERLVNHFWNEKTQKLVSFWKNNPKNHDLCGNAIHKNPRTERWRNIIVYQEFRTQGWNLFSVLPGSVTKVVWIGDHMGRSGWEQHSHLVDNVKLAQITEMDMACNPMGRRQTSYIQDFALPNLRILKLISGIDEKTTGKKRTISYISYLHYDFLLSTLQYISAPQLKTLHIKGYALSLQGWETVLTFSKSRNLNLVLSDMILRKELPNDFQYESAHDSITEEMLFMSRNLMDSSRESSQRYVEDGMVSLQGKYRCIVYREHPQLVRKQMLHQGVVSMLDEYLRTGLGEDELLTELGSEACKSIVNRVGDLTRVGFWPHDR